MEGLIWGILQYFNTLSVDLQNSTELVALPRERRNLSLKCMTLPYQCLGFFDWQFGIFSLQHLL